MPGAIDDQPPDSELGPLGCVDAALDGPNEELPNQLQTNKIRFEPDIAYIIESDLELVDGKAGKDDDFANRGIRAMLVKLVLSRGITLPLLTSVAAGGFAHDPLGRGRVGKRIQRGDNIILRTNKDGNPLFRPPRTG